MAHGQEVEAVVSGVGGGKESRFAVAYPSDTSLFPKGTTITFSLDEWEGEKPPKNGQVVILANLEQFVKGWRARSARPVVFSKKKQGESK